MPVGRLAVVACHEPVRQYAVHGVIVVFLPYGILQFEGFLKALVGAGPVDHLGEQAVNDGVRLYDDVVEAGAVLKGSCISGVAQELDDGVGRGIEPLSGKDKIAHTAPLC